MYYNAFEDCLVLETGEHSDLVILRGRQLAELMAAGFAGLAAEAERKEADPAGTEPCPWCGQPIRWVKDLSRMVDDRFPWLALNAEPHKHGTIVLSASKITARPLGQQRPTGPVYRAHVADCAEMAKLNRRAVGPAKGGADAGSPGDAGDDQAG